MTERVPTEPEGLPAKQGSDPASDYIWTGWGRPGRCLPVDGEAVGSYECAFCERPITREMDPDQPCTGRKRSDTLNNWFAL